MNPRENIVSTFSELSAELQRAAEFSLQNTNQLVVLSMRAFASEAGVKPATLLRLAQRLGYNGWGELKDAFIDELGLRNDTYVSKAEKLIAKGTQPQLYEEVFQAHQRNLAFTQHENHQAMFTRELTAQDCLLLTSFAPYSRESLDVLRAAQQAGATIVAITDSPVSPLAQAADCTLLFSIDSPSFFPSVVSGMGLAECLLAMLVARHGRDAVNKIENAERYLNNSGAYVVPGKP